MRETQRFAIALSGVVGCLSIAAGIVITGSRGLATLPVHSPPAPRAEQLPRVPMPSWSDVAGAGPTSRAVVRGRARLGAREAVPVAVTASAALGLQSDPRHALDFSNRESAIGNRQSRVPLMLRNAPRASGTDVVVIAQPRTRERDVVTGALVTAGTHIGEGFKAVGRTLKRVF